MTETTNTQVKKSLKERAKEFGVQLPFMESRDKGDIKELLGQVSTIVDYGFLKDKTKNHDYVVFVVKERLNTFYFGGQVLTGQMGQLEAEGYHEEIVEEGLPMLLTEKKSKNNRGYINVEFYPES